jgi:thymidylate kinase
VRIGRHAKSQMLLGLRGVGKTVLLNRISEIAEENGYLSILLEAPEGRRLADLLAPQLRVLLFKLSGVEKARVIANRAMSMLRSFASVFKVSRKSGAAPGEPRRFVICHPQKSSTSARTGPGRPRRGRAAARGCGATA